MGARWIGVSVIASVFACAEPTAPKPVREQKPAPWSQIALPRVEAPGLAPAAPRRPLVVVSPRAIAVDGLTVVTLRDGAVDPADKPDGALSIHIPVVTTAVKSKDAPAAALLVAADRAVQAGVLMEVLFSATQAGWHQFELVVGSGSSEAALPLRLPDKRTPMVFGDETSLRSDAVREKIAGRYVDDIRTCHAAHEVHGVLYLNLTVGPIGKVTTSRAFGLDRALERCVEQKLKAWTFAIPRDDAGAETEAAFRISFELSASGVEGPVSEFSERPPPAEPPLGMMLVVSPAKLVLASMSGLEGTLASPRWQSAGDTIAGLDATLSKIIDRRWPGGRRPPESRAIAVIVDRAVSVQRVAELVAAVRKSAAGVELFPDVLLAQPVE